MSGPSRSLSSPILARVAFRRSRMIGSRFSGSSRSRMRGLDSWLVPCQSRTHLPTRMGDCDRSRRPLACSVLHGRRRERASRDQSRMKTQKKVDSWQAKPQSQSAHRQRVYQSVLRRLRQDGTPWNGKRSAQRVRLRSQVSIDEVPCQRVGEEHESSSRVSCLQFALQEGVNGCLPALGADTQVVSFVG